MEEQEEQIRRLKQQILFGRIFFLVLAILAGFFLWIPKASGVFGAWIHQAALGLLGNAIHLLPFFLILIALDYGQKGKGQVKSACLCGILISLSAFIGLLSLDVKKLESQACKAHPVKYLASLTDKDLENEKATPDKDSKEKDSKKKDSKKKNSKKKDSKTNKDSKKTDTETKDKQEGDSDFVGPLLNQAKGEDEEDKDEQEILKKPQASAALVFLYASGQRPALLSKSARWSGGLIGGLIAYALGVLAGKTGAAILILASLVVWVLVMVNIAYLTQLKRAGQFFQSLDQRPFPFGPNRKAPAPATQPTKASRAPVATPTVPCPSSTSLSSAPGRGEDPSQGRGPADQTMAAKQAALSAQYQAKVQEKLAEQERERLRLEQAAEAQRQAEKEAQAQAAQAQRAAERQAKWKAKIAQLKEKSAGKGGQGSIWSKANSSAQPKQESVSSSSAPYRHSPDPSSYGRENTSSPALSDRPKQPDPAVEQKMAEARKRIYKDGVIQAMNRTFTSQDPADLPDEALEPLLPLGDSGNHGQEPAPATSSLSPAPASNFSPANNPNTPAPEEDPWPDSDFSPTQNIVSFDAFQKRYQTNEEDLDDHKYSGFFEADDHSIPAGPSKPAPTPLAPPPPPPRRPVWVPVPNSSAPDQKPPTKAPAATTPAPVAKASTATAPVPPAKAPNVTTPLPVAKAPIATMSAPPPKAPTATTSASEEKTSTPSTPSTGVKAPTKAPGSPEPQSPARPPMRRLVQISGSKVQTQAQVAPTPSPARPVVQPIPSSVAPQPPSRSVPSQPTPSQKPGSVVQQQAPSQRPSPTGAQQSPVPQGQEPAAPAPSRFPAYTPPPLSMLTKGQKLLNDDTKLEYLEEMSMKLDETLANFSIDAQVEDFISGPTITRFEVVPGPGVKVSKIVNLADDLALALAATAIRIEAPIPGKSAVGIEIPNQVQEAVHLRDILESCDLARMTPLTAFLGKEISGKPILCDLATMPHLLIAGATGSGKSVCINSILISLLYHTGPQDLRILMIDPKVVELSVYNNIPHLIQPVVTDTSKACAALQWAVDEMTARYELLAEYQVRDFKAFNDLVHRGKAPDEEPMPRILIIIDELADLMATTAKEVEEAVARLTAMARAAGMHLLIATQRPSVDVITGLIKANIPSRIAFAVASQVDSRTILDTGGAEKLLGRGDMLYAPLQFPKPQRGQGAFVSDQEVEAVTDYLKETYGPNYDDSVRESIDEMERVLKGEPVKRDSSELDPLYEESKKIILDVGRASVSLLKSKLKVSHSRAVGIMEQLHEHGVVGPYAGSKPREILLTKEEYEAEQQAMAAAFAPDARIDDDADRMS